MASKKPGNGETHYNQDELINHAQALFQVNPEVVAGAFHQAEQDQFTIDEAKRLIGQFLKGKVL
ncbi:hypothetical protein [Cohnella sp. WQ 127256]|uniref:hypothetical protein n=1 Tax=Cohnella sp. WQ 127256 TaxID=2938790 RepID=UPI00211825F8|nr:hypothetical protein [Cohnella sp. WQ 127256]